jgi:23S rRNA (cytosine1962-C5)-methyltransferase
MSHDAVVPPPSLPLVPVTRRAVDRLRQGHVWIYRSDLGEVPDAADRGAVVGVVDPRGRWLGQALYSTESQIALRLLTTREATVDDAFWRARLEAALHMRQRLDIDANARRLVHAEADLLPSLVVDQYDDVLVAQTLSQGTHRRRDLIVQLLVELVQPRGVLLRNDPKVRLLEGLERQVEVAWGEVPDRVRIREGTIVRAVDVRGGQKTGSFLDQQENHAAAARYARGRALDAFTYQGGFALPMAKACERVVAIDASEDAIAQLQAHAALNGIDNIDAQVANAFDVLREYDRADERFDTIVLDPPAFAKQRKAVPKALSGYKEINLRALKLLNPGGHLITCTCSAHVDEAMFGEVVLSAALDAGVPVAVVEKRMQARDHPVLLGVPETYYLKCFILRRVG